MQKVYYFFLSLFNSYMQQYLISLKFHKRISHTCVLTHCSHSWSLVMPKPASKQKRFTAEVWHICQSYFFHMPKPHVTLVSVNVNGMDAKRRICIEFQAQVQNVHCLQCLSVCDIFFLLLLNLVTPVAATKHVFPHTTCGSIDSFISHVTHFIRAGLQMCASGCLWLWAVPDLNFSTRFSCSHIHPVFVDTFQTLSPLATLSQTHYPFTCIALWLSVAFTLPGSFRTVTVPCSPAHTAMADERH